ncbi:MAG: hypothetical protein SO042_05485, partial [Bulleidia sp.]|nr:hypothetical protein [Bulleidia sp.]
LVNLLHIVKQKFPEKNIWCFTGFVYDKDLLKGQRKHTNATDEMLSYIMNKTAQKAVLFLCLLKKEKKRLQTVLLFYITVLPVLLASIHSASSLYPYTTVLRKKGDLNLQQGLGKLNLFLL